MTLILFVCRGNTCRSPIAELAARHKGRLAGLDGSVQFSSAGVSVDPDAIAADPRALASVARAGLDLSHHRPRPITLEMLLTAHHVYALDRSVLTHLRDLAPPAALPRLQLLLSLVPELHLDDVADPYSGTAHDYEHAFALIERAVTVLIKTLQLPREA